MKWTRAYKAFDMNLRCRGFQYEIGKEYTHEGVVVACESGFHACPNPLFILRYYSPDTSRFCIVEQAGKISDEVGAGMIIKRASEKIKIVREITIQELVEEHRKLFGTAKIDNDIAVACEFSTAQTSDFGISAAHAFSVALTGDHGIAAARNGSITTAGKCGIAIAKDNGIAQTSDYGISIVKRHGIATTEGFGISVSQGKSTVGINGLAVAKGNNVKVRGEIGALLVIAEEYEYHSDIKYWKAFVVDGINIKPNTWYGLNSTGEIEAYDET